MKNIIGSLVFLLIVVFANCAGEERLRNTKILTAAVVVVLGNEPLDQNTPTIDMVERVKKAAAFVNSNPDSILILTGGVTAGGVSEARMMANLALNFGVSEKTIFLEEQARTTAENAHYAAELLKDINPRRVYIVSKTDHLEWAIPMFQKFDVFQNAEALACEVSRSDSITQMQEYLKKYPENRRVRQRLNSLLQGIQGTD